MNEKSLILEFLVLDFEIDQSLQYSRDPPNDHFTKETTSVKDHFLVRTEFSPLFHVCFCFTYKTGL